MNNIHYSFMLKASDEGVDKYEIDLRTTPPPTHTHAYTHTHIHTHTHTHTSAPSPSPPYTVCNECRV